MLYLYMQLYEPSSLTEILVWLQRPAIGHPMQEGLKLGGWHVGTEIKQRKCTQANFSSVERFISRRADFQGGMLLFELCEWCVWTGPPWNFSSLLITQTYGPAKVHECISLFLHFTAQSRSFHCTFLSRDISVPPCPMLPGPAAGNGTSQSC